MRDSYERFFAEGYISKEQFFDFGLRETIFSPYDKAEAEWESLKNRIHSNEQVFIRGFGRDAGGTQLFIDLYKILLGNSNVRKDPTNNAEPAKLIRALTGYSKTSSSSYKLIRNYQVSHIFGRTKNVFSFTAPWNLVYIPKILDPFTGHEAKGKMVQDFTALFQRQAYKQFELLIEDFNGIITHPTFVQNLEESLEAVRKNGRYGENDIEKLEKALQEEFFPIVIDS